MKAKNAATKVLTWALTLALLVGALSVSAGAEVTSFNIWDTSGVHLTALDGDGGNAPMAAAGYLATLALRADGTVWGWGDNSKGQLGDGTGGGWPVSNVQPRPVQVKDLKDVASISIGSTHSVALKSDGTVWAWGENDYGQLGYGEINYNYNYTQPRQTTGITDVTAVSAGFNHTVALKSDGTVWAWGNNTYGQLGDGTTTDRYRPVQVKNLSDVIAVSSGPRSIRTVAVKSDGTVWVWGRNGAVNSSTPVIVENLTDVTAVDSGRDYTIVLKSDGTVWAWGNNMIFGQLGDGTINDSATPVRVAGLINITSVSAGEYHSVALKSDGSVWTWGANDGGQIGNGSTGHRVSPPVQVTGISNAVAVSAGKDHTVAVKSDGTVWAWGSGWLGDGESSFLGNRKTAPVQVVSMNGDGFFNVYDGAPPDDPTPPPSFEDGWKQENGYWYYYQNGVAHKGWLQTGGKWYYLDPSDGRMQTGWLRDGGVWYYLHPTNGDMRTGWLQDGGKWYFLASSGAMRTGWVSSGGKWYFMSGTGAMATGWLRQGEIWYYLDPVNGDMYTGRHTIDGVSYFFDSSGAWVPGA